MPSIRHLREDHHAIFINGLLFALCKRLTGIGLDPGMLSLAASRTQPDSYLFCHPIEGGSAGHAESARLVSHPGDPQPSSVHIFDLGVGVRLDFA